MERPDHAAAFIFLGTLEPAELANFNLSNVFLPGEDEDAVIEVLGHGIAVWWKRHVRRDFEDLRDATRDWVETIAAGHYLATNTALDVHLRNWVETLTHVDEVTVGFIDRRFRVIPTPQPSTPENKALDRSIELAAQLRGRVHLHPAAKEAWRSALDPTDEAFLSAFRALECIRRLYGSGESSDEVRAAWEAMADDIGTASEFDLLRAAAKAVRHGDRPSTRTERHPINEAQGQRDALLAYATTVVRGRVEHDLGASLAA